MKVPENRCHNFEYGVIPHQLLRVPSLGVFVEESVRSSHEYRCTPSCQRRILYVAVCWYAWKIWYTEQVVGLLAISQEVLRIITVTSMVGWDGGHAGMRTRAPESLRSLSLG